MKKLWSLVHFLNTNYISLYLGARVREDPTPESRLSRPSMFSVESSCDSSPVVMSWSLVSGDELVRLVTSWSSFPLRLSSVSRALRFFRSDRWLSSSSDLFTVELREEEGGSTISGTKRTQLFKILFFYIAVTLKRKFQIAGSKSLLSINTPNNFQ